MRRLEGIPTPQAPRSVGPCEWRPPPRPAPRPPPKRDTEFEPYQLKPKRDGETFIEHSLEEQCNASIDPKKLKRMKKKLYELNRKIRHSRKKHDGMIHKRNALRKAIEGLKHAPNKSPYQNLSGFLTRMSKLSMGPTEALGLIEDPEWMSIHSSVK